MTQTSSYRWLNGLRYIFWFSLFATVGVTEGRRWITGTLFVLAMAFQWLVDRLESSGATSVEDERKRAPQHIKQGLRCLAAAVLVVAIAIAIDGKTLAALSLCAFGAVLAIASFKSTPR